MSQGRVRRKLSAVLALDVVSYSRLMAADEVETYAALVDCQKSILEPSVSSHGGRIVKLMGDGALVEFQSVVDAVESGILIQEGFSKRNSDLPQAKAILVRIGINLGDIILDRGDIFGDGVNIAARLEAIADPGCICIAGSVYDQVKSKVDVEFQDLGEQTFKNLAEPVRVYQVKPAGCVPTLAASATSANSVRPSIAILPFDNLSGDADQQYFCDGVSEDLTTGLSRFDWLFVAARNAAFRYQGQPVDVKRVGRELGVRYVLEGSVRLVGTRARVNVQLIEVDRQGHVWADRLDADVADPFEAQDDVVTRIASTLGPEIIQAEVSKALLRRNEELSAWDHYLLALRGYFTMTEPAVETAITHLSTAIDLEPDFVMAYGLLALCHGQSAAHGWTRPAREGFRRAGDLANTAIRMAPGTTGVAVNTKYYSGNIDTAAIFLDPPEELKGKINVVPEVGDVLSMAIMYHGGQPCTDDRELLKKVRDTLVEAKKSWLAMDYGSVEQFAKEDYWAGVSWNGATYRMRLQNENIRYGYPKEGFIVWMDSVAVLADAKNVDEAKAFQNFIMAPENAALISEFARYANGIVGSEAFMPEDMKTAREIVIPAEFKDKGVFIPACSPDVQQLYTRIWTDLQK